jgi:hypothetical protein
VGEGNVDDGILSYLIGLCLILANCRIVSSQIITQSPPLGLNLETLPPGQRTTWEANWDIKDFKTRVTHLWLLDFNRCKKINRDASGVSKAVRAFFANDPYYPRPCSNIELDRKLWTVFASRYLERSAEFFDDSKDEDRELPRHFIDSVVKEQEKRNNQRAAGETIRLPPVDE